MKREDLGWICKGTYNLVQKGIRIDGAGSKESGLFACKNPGNYEKIADCKNMLYIYIKIYNLAKNY